MSNFEMYDDLFEPVIIEDRFGKIIYFNYSLLSLLKLNARYFKKQDDAEVFFKELIPSFMPYFVELRSATSVLTKEIDTSINDGKFTFIIKGLCVEDNFHYLIKDMTVEKQLYDKYKLQMEELKLSHSQILQSDKLKVVGEMTANISHEINNPLTVAMGNSEMIGFSLESNDFLSQKANIEKFNKNIQQSINRINKIITNMKEFLHQSEDTKEYISAKELIKKSVSFLMPIFEQNKISFKMEVDLSEPVVFVNSIKLEQVFVNMFQNSLDALRESLPSRPLIKVHLHQSDIDGYIAIDITDNGPGVSLENREKIFNTFFTTKEVGKGTGLGLSISNRIIESHQGKLELKESETGAFFRISLPSVSISSYVAGDWEKMHTTNLNYKKVLVVDNDPNILNLCMNFFKHSDFYFLGATSASEAEIQLKRVSVDIIITDLKMPNIGGEDFVRNLRKNNIHTPVFYMTSKDAIDQFNKIKSELNLSGMIIKPFTRDELIKSVESIKYDKK